MKTEELVFAHLVKAPHDKAPHDEDDVASGDDLVEDADITPTSNRTTTTQAAVDDVYRRTTASGSARAMSAASMR